MLTSRHAFGPALSVSFSQLLWSHSPIGSLRSSWCSQDPSRALGGQRQLGRQWLVSFRFPCSRPDLAIPRRFSCLRTAPRPLHHLRHLSSPRLFQHFEDPRRRAGLHRCCCCCCCQCQGRRSWQAYSSYRRGLVPAVRLVREAEADGEEERVSQGRREAGQGLEAGQPTGVQSDFQGELIY